MRVFGTSLAMVLGLLLAQAANAGEECCGGSAESCGRCGCHSRCEKYCKVVPDTKEIKKHVWVVKCEDFCPPLPTCDRKCGHGCGQSGDCGQCGDCQDGGAACGCGGHGCPKCGCVRTKKVLEKKEITCKIPCWKCVVVYACPGCSDGCCSEGFAPADSAAPMPKAAPLPPGPKRPLPPPPPTAR